MNITYQHRVEHGLCRQCGASIPATSRSKSRCPACLERHLTQARERYGKRKIAAVCTQCGKPPLEGTKLCQLCTDAAATRNHNWRERRKASDRCMYCNEPKWQKSMACQYHTIEKKLVQFKIPGTAVPLLLKRLEAQDFKCFYTGVPLVAGVNLSIDHYHSRKRNPDLESDVNNLVWADEQFNNMKRDTPIKELFAMCKAVVAHEAAILAGVTPVTP